MKLVYINYADESFLRQQKFAIKRALNIGGFNQAIGYSIKDIDSDFLLENRQVFSEKKGVGLWLWKPYIILKTLSKMEDGDVLLYADAGSYMVDNINHILVELLKKNQDVMAFELPLIERQWTKSDLFLALNCNEDSFIESNMISSSFHLVKKSNVSVEFYKELLSLTAKEENLISLNHGMEKENFIEHRYDQSIFSLLYKKNGFKPFKDPTQFGLDFRGYTGDVKCLDSIKKGVIYRSKENRDFRINEYSESYGMVIFHNRTGEPTLRYLQYVLKSTMAKLGLYKKPVY